VKLSFGEIAAKTSQYCAKHTPTRSAMKPLVGFYLPKAAKGILTIRDTKGSLIYRVDGTYSKGENKVDSEAS